MSSLKGVLLDVGGTLWPDVWSDTAGLDSVRARRLSVLAGIPIREAASLARTLESLATQKLATNLHRDTDGLIRGAVDHLWPAGASAGMVAAVRQGMCLPAAAHITLFDGVRDLLRDLRRRGLRPVLVTNSNWRDAVAYRRDLEAFGCGSYVHAIVTSLDVGYRKPHPAIFRAALEAAECPPESCAVVGNSELNDIRPAIELGARSVLVAIESDPRRGHGGRRHRHVDPATAPDPLRMDRRIMRNASVYRPLR